MNHAEKMKLFLEIKTHVFHIVRNVFDEMDKEIESAIFTHEGLQVARAARLRMSLKGIRSVTLDGIKKIGSDVGAEDVSEDDDTL